MQFSKKVLCMLLMLSTTPFPALQAAQLTPEEQRVVTIALERFPNLNRARARHFIVEERTKLDRLANDYEAELFYEITTGIARTRQLVYRKNFNSFLRVMRRRVISQKGGMTTYKIPNLNPGQVSCTCKVHQPHGNKPFSHDALGFVKRQFKAAGYQDSNGEFLPFSVIVRLSRLLKSVAE